MPYTRHVGRAHGRRLSCLRMQNCYLFHLMRARFLMSAHTTNTCMRFTARPPLSLSVSLLCKHVKLTLMVSDIRPAFCHSLVHLSTCTCIRSQQRQRRRRIIDDNSSRKSERVRRVVSVVSSRKIHARAHLDRVRSSTSTASEQARRSHKKHTKIRK